MKDIKSALEQFESQWFNDFRGYPLEDADVFEYGEDEEGEEVIEIDPDALKREMESLVSYTVDRATEEDQDGESEMSDLWMCWKVRIEQFIKTYL